MPAGRYCCSLFVLTMLLMHMQAWAMLRRPDTLPQQASLPDNPRHKPVDDAWLFADDTPLELIVETNRRQLLRSLSNPALQPARVVLRTAGSTLFQDDIAVRARGSFRKENCSIPQLLLDFTRHRSGTPVLHARLKLVSPCQYGPRYEELLYREYLAYRLYGLFTEKSFRVRRVHLTMIDGEGRRKPWDMPSFLIEDVDDMARRNGCHEVEPPLPLPGLTDRQQLTLLSLFQYMIGNTDWAVSQMHNIRLIRSNSDSLARPYGVPYDFDYCGLVNAPYAIPDERLGIPDVRTRLYMGPPRNLAEIRHFKQLFLDREAAVLQLVGASPGINSIVQREIRDYLQLFFDELRQREVEAKLSPGGWGFSQNEEPRPLTGVHI